MAFKLFKFEAISISINISLILLGPLLAVATYLFLGPFNVAGQSVWLRFFLF